MNETKKVKLLSPKLDVVFQALFGEVGSERITKDFLETILSRKITQVNLEGNQIMRRKNPEDKLGILDVMVKINGEEKCDIEKYHTTWKIMETGTAKKILTDKLEFHIIEIEKMREYKEDDKLIDWIEFLNNPKSERVRKKMEENKALKEAGEKLEEMSEDERLQRLAWWIEKGEMDRGSELSHARKDGIQEGKIEIARKMKNKNMRIEENNGIDRINERGNRKYKIKGDENTNDILEPEQFVPASKTDITLKRIGLWSQTQKVDRLEDGTRVKVFAADGTTPIMVKKIKPIKEGQWTLKILCELIAQKRYFEELRVSKSI